MTQQTIDGNYLIQVKNIKRIVEEHLEMCWTCRNDDIHLRNHIYHNEKYKWIDPELIRRTRQRIQNDQGKFLADPETQRARAAKQLFMQNNISKL